LELWLNRIGLLDYTTAVASHRVKRGGAVPFVVFKGYVFFSFMKTKLRRYYGRKDLHFITFSCYQRKPLLGSPRGRDLFVKVLAETRRRYGFLLIGYVDAWKEEKKIEQPIGASFPAGEE